MPNKYSHSVVLATYSSQGLITLPKDQYLAYLEASPTPSALQHSGLPSRSPSRIQTFAPNPSTTASSNITSPYETASTKEAETEWQHSDEANRRRVIIDAENIDDDPSVDESVRSMHRQVTVGKDASRLQNDLEQPGGRVSESGISRGKSTTSSKDWNLATQPEQPTAQDTAQHSTTSSRGQIEQAKAVVAPRHSSLHANSTRRSRASTKTSVASDQSKSGSNPVPAPKHHHRVAGSGSSAITTPIQLPPAKTLPSAAQGNRRGSQSMQATSRRIRQPMPGAAGTMSRSQNDDIDAVGETESSDTLPQELDFSGFSEDDEPDWASSTITGSHQNQGVASRDFGRSGLKYGTNSGRSTAPHAFRLAENVPRAKAKQRHHESTSQSTYAPLSSTRHRRGDSSSSNEVFGVPSIVRTPPKKETAVYAEKRNPRAISRPSSTLPDMPRESLAAIFNPRLLDNAALSDDSLPRRIGASSLMSTSIASQSNVYSGGDRKRSAITSMTRDSDDEAAPAPEIAKYRAMGPPVPMDDTEDDSAYPPNIAKHRERTGIASPLAQVEAVTGSQDARGRDRAAEAQAKKVNEAGSVQKAKGSFFSRLREKSLGRRG